jgi:hypothetical protein
MSEKKSLLSWVGFTGEEPATPGSVDRIRELETQLADLRSRRDITALSKEEFEILATETAMSMIKSAQLREARAQASADRLVNETSRLVNETSRAAKDALEAAQNKAASMLSSAEARGRKYIQTAEAEADEMIANAEEVAERAMNEKRREVTALAQAARRESERLISGATAEVSNYRQWLSGVISEAERLYRIQTQSLDAAEGAIHQSRARLEMAFTRLEQLQKNVLDNLNADDTIINRGPIRVESQRTKAALNAPKGKTTKKVAKKSSAKSK